VLVHRLALALAFFNTLPTIHAVELKTLSIGNSNFLRRRADSSAVVCRVTVFGVQATGNNNTASTSPNTHQKTICIPIVDDQELDNDFEIVLPSELASLYSSDIHQGKLIVSIVGAALDDNGLIQISDDPQFNVLKDPRFDRHRVRHLEATGTKSVAVIRVSTLDASPKDSATTLKSSLFGSGGTNFVTQFDACSHGNLKWELKNNEILDVQVPVYITDYANDSTGLITALQLHMKKEMGYSSVSAIAEKVIMCLPSGTGNWAAAAGVNHWRVQMNDDWCLSLSAAMHELGKQSDGTPLLFQWKDKVLRQQTHTVLLLLLLLLL